MIRLTDLAGKGSFTMGGKKFEYGKVYSNPSATAFKPVNEAEGEDHEVSMAQNQLDSIIKHATELKQKVGEQEKDIPAWIQDHITNSENYISQAASNYHEYGQNEGTIKEDSETKRLEMLIKNLEETNKLLVQQLKDNKSLSSNKKQNIKKSIALNLDLINYYKKWLKDYQSAANESIKEAFNIKLLPTWLFDDVKDFEYWYKHGMALGSGRGKIDSLNSSDEKKLFDLIKKWKNNDSTAQDNIKQLFKQKGKVVKSESIKEDSPCWKGYKQVGMKNKGGRQVPNCVPEGVVNEAGLYGGVPKMYVKYLAVQKKVRELEDAQRAMGAKYFAEKNPKKKEAMMPLLKKGTNQLEMYRRNLADIERKYIDNLYKDVEQSPDFE